MIKDKPSKVPEILLPVLRQYQHNDCSGSIAGFDYEGTIKIVNSMRKALEYQSTLLYRIGSLADQHCYYI